MAHSNMGRNSSDFLDNSQLLSMVLGNYLMIKRAGTELKYHESWKTAVLFFYYKTWLLDWHETNLSNIEISTSR